MDDEIYGSTAYSTLTPGQRDRETLCACTPLRAQLISTVLVLLILGRTGSEVRLELQDELLLPAGLNIVFSLTSNVRKQSGIVVTGRVQTDASSMRGCGTS